MKISVINHRQKNWIAIETDYNDKRLVQIKAVKGRKWSQTNKKWLIPNTKENQDFIKSLLKVDDKKATDVVKLKKQKELTTNHLAVKKSKPKSSNLQKKAQQKSTILILKGNRLRISFYPSKEGVRYIKSLSLYRYNIDYKQWTIPYTEKNLEKMLFLPSNEILKLMLKICVRKGQKKYPNPQRLILENVQKK